MPTKRGLARLAFVLAVAWILFVSTPLAYYYGQPLRVATVPQRSDVIVLMSSGALDQNWLSPDAAQRTWGALRLYREGYGSWIVSSGSNPEEGFHQAEMQATWLIRAGVPEDRIVVENRSSRTYQSVIEIVKLMKQHAWRTAVVVTSELDVPRLRMVFESQQARASFLAVPECPLPSGLLYLRQGFNAFYHATYEYAGLVLYKFKGWI